MGILTVRDIGKTYGANTVLDGVSFELNAGEILSVLGPSGCGKTTLLRILIGLEQPTAGTILKDGADITALPPDKRGMGIVFQNYALFENMTVLQNVEYAIRLHKDLKPQSRAIAEQLIEQVGLTEHARKRPRQLSGGQQQRVAIARTLALRPDILLFDEPMAALDADMRLTMRRELLDIRDRTGAAMIYITHDQEEAFAMSDRIMVLGDGHIRQLDTPENIIAHPADEYVQTFVLHNLQLKLDSLSRFAR